MAKEEIITLFIRLTYYYLVAMEMEDGKGRNYCTIHSLYLVLLGCHKDGRWQGGNYYTIQSSNLFVLGCHRDGRWQRKKLLYYSFVLLSFAWLP